MTEVLLADALGGAEVFTDGDWVESKDQDPNGDVRLVQLADVGVGTYLDKSARFMMSGKAAELRCTYLKAGDVLVARMPDPLGRACVFPGDPKPSVTVVDVCIIRTDQKAVDSRWLMHWFNSERASRAMERSATGTTRKRISRSNLGKLRIPLPPIEEQRRIAAVLDTADALRAKRRQALAKLDTLTQAIFIDMFGDQRCGNGRWAMACIGELARNEDSTRVPVKLADREAMFGQYPYYGASGVIDSVNGYLFDGRRLLVAEDGANLLARSSPIAFLAEGRFWVNNHAHVLADNGAANLVYLREALQLLDVSPFVTGSAQPKLTRRNLDSIRIALPERALQDEFEFRISQVDRSFTVASSHSGQLDTLFASLQQRAFRGEL